MFKFSTLFSATLIILATSGNLTANESSLSTLETNLSSLSVVVVISFYFDSFMVHFGEFSFSKMYKRNIKTVSGETWNLYHDFVHEIYWLNRLPQGKKNKNKKETFGNGIYQ